MIGAVLREAIASARSQPVASLLTVLIVAAMILTVMLTTGRTVAAEQSVISTIDSAGTRSITVRAEDGAGITSDVLTRIQSIEGIEWAAGFSAAIDGTNSLVADGTRVPVRYAYSAGLERLGIPAPSPVPGGLAYASRAALDQLGLDEIAGGITLTNGGQYGVAGVLDTPDFLVGFEPLVLVPRPDELGTVNVLVVIAERPDLVSPVAAAVLSVLAPDDPTKVTVQTSEALAELRAIIESQLGTFSRGLVLIMLGVTGALVAIILTGLVLLRRKDFGRRRALGATRGLITGLLLAQTALLACTGVVVGSLAGVVTLRVLGDPLPGPEFPVALGILAVATATVTALVPALIASRRQPITELRVP